MRTRIKGGWEVSWIPGAIPNLESWVRKLASTSSYVKHSFPYLARGRWEAKNHEIVYLPTLPTLSDRQLQEAQAIGTLDVERAHEREGLFRGCFMGVEDATNLSEALSLHRDPFSKSRVEMSRWEADLQSLMEERNALKLLIGQKKEEIKDLQAELATAHKEQTDLIEQLREEANMMRAATLGWKQNMDYLASDKDAARAQLSSAEHQLKSMKKESSSQSKKIEELEARLTPEIENVTSEAEKVKADMEEIVSVY
ncbi:uncharacterized protein [Nicotiana sylvestris]|uniref:uncharacterized protein n=1 Tax=Nicotiana sylvestris TaxID=4096 RepID=UPI00388CA773